MRRSASLQGQLLAWVLGLVVLVWLFTATLTWFDARHELDELLDSHLAQAAALLVAQQAHELGDDDHQVDSPPLHRYAPRAAFQVFHEGRLALRSANAPATPMFGSIDGSPSGGFGTVDFGGTTWRVFAARGAERDVQVFVGEQLASRNEILLAVLRSTMWPMMAALPLLALAVWWAVRRGVLPLRRLGQVLGERSPQELQPVVVDGAPSEMAPALDALNSLLHRIGDLVESERRFTADAAHELRTPIAAIRAQAQVALGEADDGQRRHALQATLAGCDRATRLVDQLLTLARLEAAPSTTLAEVDLGALVRRAVADLAPAAIHKHQEIALDAVDGCVVNGDATLLAVLVRNLVDNAIRYSPARAAVKIAVTRLAGRVLLQVDDSGPGLNEGDLKRMGERFFRVMGTGEDGSGLGWSIVRRIAAAHRTDIRIGRSTLLGGLAVQVEWPR
ncbi:MAG: ATP-binding protein [Burkholderiaceae bacterium]